MTLAAAEKNTYHQKNKDFEVERDTLLTEATNTANTKHKALLEAARIEAEALRVHLEQSLKNDQQNISREIRERTQQEVIAISRKVLADLASTSLEEQIVAVFIRRLAQIKGEEKERLIESLTKAAKEIIIKSAFELSLDQQAAIEKAILPLTSDPIRCRFDISSKTISGIELNVDGYKMAWSVADYLDSLEKVLAEMLNGHPDFQATSKPTKNEPTV